MKNDVSKADIARKSLSAIGWNYIGAGTRVIAQLVLQITLARILGPQAFGQATAVMIVLGIGWLLAEAGFGRALIQKPEVSERDIGFALGWILITSLAIGLVIVVAAETLARLLGEPGISNLLMLAGILVPIQCFANISSSLMQRRLEMKRLQAIQLGTYVFCYGAIALPLAWFGMGALSLIVAFAAQGLCVLGLGYSHTRHTLRPTLNGDKKLLYFGLKISAINISNWAIDNLDRVIVSRYWGAVALGNYAVAANLSRAPVTLIVNSMQAVLFSSASRIQENYGKIGKVYVALLATVSLVCVPLFSFLAVKSKLVISVLYGDLWYGAVPLFAAFCVSVPFFAIVSVTGPLLQAVNAAGSELKVQIISATAIVVGFWALTESDISAAVWLIPIVTALRAFWLFVSLARKIDIAYSAAARALAGPMLFGTYVIVAVYAGEFLFIEKYSSAGTAVLFVVALVFASIRAAPRSMLSHELADLLVSRFDDTKVIRLLCLILGLRRQDQ